MKSILSFVPEPKRQAAQNYVAQLESEKIPFLVRGLIFMAVFWAGVFVIWTGELLDVSVWAGAVLLTALGFILTYRLRVSGPLKQCAVLYMGVLCTLAGQLCFVGALMKTFSQDEWAVVLVAVVSYPFFKSTWNRLFWCAAAAVALFISVQEETFAMLVQLSFISFGVSLAVFLMRELRLYPAAYGALFLTCLIWANQVTDIAYGWVLVPCVMSLAVAYAGFRNYDRILEYVGVGCLIASVFFVYYNMTLSLSLKALPLILSGCLLLVLGRKYAK